MGCGMHPLAALNLTPEQLEAMQATAQATKVVSLDLTKRIGDEAAKLRPLFAEAASDAEKIGAAYQGIFDLQRWAIENPVAAINKRLSILASEQLRTWNTIRKQMIARFPPPGNGPQSMCCLSGKLLTTRGVLRQHPLRSDLFAGYHAQA
jgi:hypothetical protein